MGRVFIALDIETTGLDPARDAITEIAAIRFRDDRVLDTWSTLVNPKRPIPYNVQRLTHITPEDVRDAPALVTVIPQFVRFVGDHPIVGHNVDFEYSFLQRHDLLLNNPPIDTFQLASILLPQVPSYSLADLAKYLGIKLHDHHRALPDATAAKDLFLALMEHARQMDLAVLQEINRMAAHSQWRLRQIFLDLEGERARTAFASNIREQLLAKGHLDEAALGLVLDRRQLREPLRPTDREIALDEHELADLLSPDGLFAKRFPGYEYRPQQIEMLRAVVRAFNNGGQALIEAGTGIGKSLAYLLPAIHFAVRNGRRVVVSTNTINLQDQLCTKDIPDLRKVLPIEFKAALLKGRSNYLCLRRLGIFRRSDSLQDQEAQVLAKILAWLPVTETGDSAELALREQEFAIWGRVQSEQEACLGDKCPHLRKGRCFLYRARSEAEAAHVIVVNHALLLSDMTVANRVLPEYHHLVIDEAHHLEARATEQLGFAVSRHQTQSILSGLAQRSESGQTRGFLPSLPQYFRGSSVSTDTQRQVAVYLTKLQPQIESAQSGADRFFDALQAFVNDFCPADTRTSTAYDRQIELTRGVRAQPAWSDLEVLADELDDDLRRVEAGIEGLHKGFSELEDQGILQYDDLLQELWSRLEHVRELREQLKAIVCEPQEGGIYWFRIGSKNGEVALHSAPLQVGPLLEKSLFPKLETVIFTSATLRTTKDFSYLRERLTLPDADELVVNSPFDYPTSTLLCLPDDMPEPAHPGQPNYGTYQKALNRAIADLCLETRGRALVLFTSYQQLKATYNIVSREMEEAGIAVFGQGLGGSRRQLLENFKNTPNSVLLGTRSFWEGVDVVGPALSCLIIVHLPFSVPSDPVFAARSRMFDDPFGEYAVPEAVLRFRQGFGRLIRSCTDRGVVVVLDKRVVSKKYGVSFLDSLPECTRFTGSLKDLPKEAARWIEAKRPEERG